MEDKNLKLWQVIVALSSLAIVIGTMIYWLNDNVGDKMQFDAQKVELESQIANLEEEIASLTETNRQLKNRPVEEISVEKECPPCKQEMMVEETTPCPECPKCDKVKIGEFSIGKPISVANMVCTKMAIGKWDMPKSCEKELARFVDKKIDENGNFFVITPIVDTRKYKGKQPELKQAGLGQFRAQQAKKSIKTKVAPNIAVFQKSVIEKKDMRGFIVELYQLESYK